MTLTRAVRRPGRGLASPARTAGARELRACLADVGGVGAGWSGDLPLRPRLGELLERLEDLDVQPSVALREAAVAVREAA